MRYLLASLMITMTGCATINFQSVNLSCSDLPNWVWASIVCVAVVAVIGLFLSEWMSLSSKIKANGIIQYLIPTAISLYSWIRSKINKEPPKT